MRNKRTIPLLTALIACAVLTANVRGDEDDGFDPMFESQLLSESCVLKITWEDGVSSLSPKVIEALLRSSGVWGSALQSAFGKDMLQARDYATLHMETLNENTMKLPNGKLLNSLVARLTLEVEDEGTRMVKGNAKPTFEKICNSLHKAILEFGESAIISQRQMQANYEQELEHAQLEFHKILTERRAFLEKTQAYELDKNHLAGQLRDLHEKKAELEMEQTVAHARRDAMQEQIARLSAKAKAEPIPRDDVEQLRVILGIRQDALVLGQDQVQRGMISEHELQSLKVDAAQAAAELARAQADAQREHDAKMHELGGGFIIEMNHDLTRMAIDEADTQAKYHAILERIGQVRESLKIAEEYEHMGGDHLHIARQRLETARRNLARIEQQVSTSQRPTMTIVGASKL